MQGWQIVVWIVILQSVTEMYVTHNYTITVSFITPTSLLMVQTVEASPHLADAARPHRGDRHRRVRGARRHRGRLRAQVPRCSSSGGCERDLRSEKTPGIEVGNDTHPDPEVFHDTP